ncbi:MAG: permease prefix domain 1-containing protein [Planctomycetota bacterium]
MSEREFEAYLNLLARTLKLSEAQRQRISGELRDHLEERLQELTDDGIDREAAVSAALEEFGEANTLADNLTNRRKLKKMKYLASANRPRLVALSLVALALLAFGVYRGAFYTPTPSVPNASPDSPLASAPPSSTETRKPGPQALIEATVYDADPVLWESFRQISIGEAEPNASVLLLPNEATVLPTHLQSEASLTRLASPNLLVPFGESAELLIGESEVGDQPNHVRTSGVGIHVTPWWHHESRTLEMSLTFYAHRAIDTETLKPIATTTTQSPGINLESTTSRAWLQNG